jgi:hypothetical protein
MMTHNSVTKVLHSAYLQNSAGHTNFAFGNVTPCSLVDSYGITFEKEVISKVTDKGTSDLT